MALIAAILFLMPAGATRREPIAGAASGWYGGTPGREQRGRPLGVVLIGIYDVVVGLAALSLGLWGALAGEVLAELPIFLVPAEAPAAVIVLSLAAAGLGAVTLATAYGICSLQAWGRRLQAALCLIDIPLQALALFAGQPSAGSLLGVAALLVDGAILVYISRPVIQELYANDAWDVDDGREPAIEDERFTPSL
jgi:hypothetical protein